MSLALSLAFTATTPAQGPGSDDDLFREQPTTPTLDQPLSEGQETGQIAAPRLVRVLRDAKVLYEDRTRKIVYDCKLFSDDSRVYHGDYVEFYRNGKEFCRGQYRDGRRHGKWTFRQPSGAVVKQGEYVDDRPTGKWVYLRNDGVVSREETYKDGLPHGLWVRFGQDGKTPVSQIEFVDGKPVQREPG